MVFLNATTLPSQDIVPLRDSDHNSKGAYGGGRMRDGVPAGREPLPAAEGEVWP